MKVVFNLSIIQLIYKNLTPFSRCHFSGLRLAMMISEWVWGVRYRFYVRKLLKIGDSFPVIKNAIIKTQKLTFKRPIYELLSYMGCEMYYMNCSKIELQSLAKEAVNIQILCENLRM